MLLTNFGDEFRLFCRNIDATSRLRMAPTPSGFLHIGNALNFILNWLATRLHPGACLLLRIDDIDADRVRPEFIEDIFETLSWLGLDWDDGPRAVASFHSTWSQRLRLQQYSETLHALCGTGLVFACAKSRSELAPHEGRYPPVFRAQGLSLDNPDVAWRIRTPELEIWPDPMPSDFIVRRRDGIPAYQIASLTDDVCFGITHLIRGADLAPSTSAQRFLADCLGWETFRRIHCLHHPLIRDAAGAKLSKSAGANSLRTWRAEHRTPEAVFRMVSTYLGLREPACCATELLEASKMRL